MNKQSKDIVQQAVSGHFLVLQYMILWYSLVQCSLLVEHIRAHYSASLAQYSGTVQLLQ